MSADSPLYLAAGMKSDAEFIREVLPGADVCSVTRNPLGRDGVRTGGRGRARPEVISIASTSRWPRGLGKIVRACIAEEVRAHALGERKAPANAAEKAMRRALRETSDLRSVSVRTHDRASFGAAPLAQLAELGAPAKG